MLTGMFRDSRKAATTVLFATAIVPILMIVGMSIDYGFYNAAQSQLNMAADASAMVAARVTAQAVQANATDYLIEGQNAGLAWFAAQMGSVPQAKNVYLPTVDVKYSSTDHQAIAKVSYNGIIGTHFGGIFAARWTYWPNLGIAGSATAVVNTETFTEFDILVDNSSSMLIGATPGDIQNLQTASVCSTQAANMIQPMDANYSWYYNAAASNNLSAIPITDAKGTQYYPYGYGTFTYTNNMSLQETANEALPPTNAVIGACWPGFSGGAAECSYAPKAIIPTLNALGQCVSTSGVPTGGATGNYVTPKGGLTKLSNVPQAPCAFACHNSATNNDYYGLARSLGVTLRFDVVQQAVQTLIGTLITNVQTHNSGNSITMGAYEFNTGLTRVYTPVPVTPQITSVQELNAALTAVENITTPVVGDNADTDFPDSMTALISNKYITQAGNGSNATVPRKYLFIITDGMQDYNAASGRLQGPITVSPYCDNIKALGVAIYVLYTTYNPLPNPFYLQYDKAAVEGSAGANGDTPVVAALKQCASAPADFAQANSSTDINTQLQILLQKALNSPGLLSD